MLNQSIILLKYYLLTRPSQLCKSICIDWCTENSVHWVVDILAYLNGTLKSISCQVLTCVIASENKTKKKKNPVNHHPSSWRICVFLFTANYPEKKVAALFFENWNLDFSLSWAVWILLWSWFFSQLLSCELKLILGLCKKMSRT